MEVEVVRGGGKRGRGRVEGGEGSLSAKDQELRAMAAAWKRVL